MIRWAHRGAPHQKHMRRSFAIPTSLMQSSFAVSSILDVRISLSSKFKSMSLHLQDIYQECLWSWYKNVEPCRGTSQTSAVLLNIICSAEPFLSSTCLLWPWWGTSLQNIKTVLAELTCDTKSFVGTRNSAACGFPTCLLFSPCRQNSHATNVLPDPVGILMMTLEDPIESTASFW